MNVRNSDQDIHSSRALRTLSIATITGLLSIVLFAFQAATHSEFFSYVSVGFMVAGASLLLGGILGFLFGIPRTLQHEGAPADSSSGETSVDYRMNTNLEQISDWLTKMLVGVGLTQLTSIHTNLQKITVYVAAGLGGHPGSSVLALAVILYFTVVGFLIGYLWTRLYLAGAFRFADMRAIGALASRVEQTDKKIEEFKKQSEIDVEALNLTYRQLNPGPEVPTVSQEELNTAVNAASRSIRVQIVNQAWSVRGDNWRDNKPRMEATIPIFRALIHADPENRYHMNHGQLGFALKDQQEPDWREAEREIAKAIEIRGSWQDNGWLFYEFNRAICRIKLDEAFTRGEPADPSTRKAIRTDLQAAWQSDLRSLVERESLIKDWMKANKISKAALRRSA